VFYRLEAERVANAELFPLAGKNELAGDQGR
jgi:hypothetical protein